jgi:hypothetical protein
LAELEMAAIRRLDWQARLHARWMADALWGVMPSGPEPVISRFRQVSAEELMYIMDAQFE